MDTSGRGTLSDGRTVTFLLPLQPTGPVLQAEGKRLWTDMAPAPRVVCTGSGSGESLHVCVSVCVCILYACTCVHIYVVWCGGCVCVGVQGVNLLCL